jgi:hypothetical protein
MLNVGVGAAEGEGVGVTVALDVAVAVVVGVGGRVPDGVTVGVGLSVGGTVLVAVALGVGVSVGCSVGGDVGVDPPGPGAPSIIQDRTFSISAGDSGPESSGMRLSSPGPGSVNLISKKLSSGVPGTTRSRPAARAAALVGATPTRSLYDTPASSTRPPACVVEL